MLTIFPLISQESLTHAGVISLRVTTATMKDIIFASRLPKACSTATDICHRRVECGDMLEADGRNDSAGFALCSPACRIRSLLENKFEKTMENYMETGICKGYISYCQY